jgi:hypothetical protein
MSGTYNTSVPAIAAPSVPTNQTMPDQQGGTTPASADSSVSASAASARTVLGPARPRPVTLKSSYNKLADQTLA